MMNWSETSKQSNLLLNSLSTMDYQSKKFSSETDRLTRPKTYAEINAKIGDKGKYQFFLLIIFCGLWAVTGMVLMGTPFFFLNHSFACKKAGLLNSQCRNSVCSLSQSYWDSFVIPQEDYIQSISTEIGEYFCDDEFYLDITQSSTYLGAFVGYLLFSFVSDNYGRRKTLVLSWAIATAGCAIFLFSQNLPMVAIGLFMIGGGSDAAVNLCFYFLGEVVEFHTRQRYSVILQLVFPFGAIILTTAFVWIHDWQVVTIIFLMIPSIIVMFFIVLYVEQTPRFLLRGDINKSLKALNRIGKINLGIQNVLEIKDLQNVILEQVEDKQFNKIITPLDLCRFKSLRLRTISLCYISFAVYTLYYAPAMVIDKLGFNMFASSYIVQLSEIAISLPGFFFIDSLPRKKAGIVLFSITGICSVIVLFINKPEDCHFCSQAILELSVVAIFRSSIALYFLVNNIYLVEVFPSRARALGSGVASAAGTLGSTVTPVFLGFFQRNSLNPNTVFALLALLGIGTVTLLPETLNKPLQDEIEEIKLEKKQLKEQKQKLI